MADHARRPARDQRTVRPGVAMPIIALALAAAVGGVVYVNTRSNPASDAQQQTQAEQPADTQDAKDTQGERQDSAQSSEAKDATASDDAQKQDAQDSESKDEATGESAPMGNAYTDRQNGETTEASQSQDGSSAGSSSSSTSDGSSTSDSSSSDGSSSAGGSSSSGSAGSTSDSGSSGSSSSGPLYDASSGWITAGSCATSVDEQGSTVTSSEIPFDDGVPQVGLDTRSYPYAHFGDYVEISYNGTTVRAQVVDCGYYGAGTEGIMVNPGVYEQFGCYDPDDWGRRQVEYRFV